MDEIKISSGTQRIVIGNDTPGVQIVPSGPQGAPGTPGAQGPEGPMGPAGPSGGETYVHTQGSSLDVWVIQHNLGRYPSVEVVDSAGSLVMGSVSYTDINQVVVSFVYPFSGKAYLN